MPPFPFFPFFLFFPFLAFPVTGVRVRASPPANLHPAMFYTGIVLTIVALHAAAFLILLGHWVVAAGLFPKATRTLAGVFEQRPLRALLVGIFTYGPIMLLFVSNSKLPGAPLRILVVAAGAVSLLVAFIGSAGLALRIGRNLCAGGDLWQQALRGGVMLALVFITPILGWLVVLPLGLASGFGAVLLARPWRSDESPLPANVPAIPATTPASTAVPSLS